MCTRYSRSVFASDRSPVAAAEAAASIRGGSGTYRNSGMENTSHHAATITNERRTASAAPDSPNVAGERVIATLTAKSNPPPM